LRGHSPLKGNTYRLGAGYEALAGLDIVLRNNVFGSAEHSTPQPWNGCPSKGTWYKCPLLRIFSPARISPTFHQRSVEQSRIMHPFLQSRKLDVKLPGKGNSNSHGTRPVHPNHLDDKVDPDQ
jgi:hypothetical protein